MVEKLTTFPRFEHSIVGVPGIEAHGDAFLCAVAEVSHNLGIEPDWLAAVMSFESGVDPHQINLWCAKHSPDAPDACATGLIQFMPATARGLGTTTAALREMTALDQLSYVEAFYARHAGKLTDVGDLYLATFMPAALSKPDDFVLGDENDDSEIWGLRRSKIYEQNAGLDSDRKGYFTAGDVRQKLRDYYARHAQAPRAVFTCPPTVAVEARKEIPLGGRAAIGGGFVIVLAGLGLLALAARSK